MAPELRSRAEEAPREEDLRTQNERLRKLNEDFFDGVDQEIRDKIAFYRRECELMSQEIETSGNLGMLARDNPSNLAIQTIETSLSSEASERERRFDQHAEVLFAQPTEAIEGLPQLRQQVVDAHDQLAPTGNPGFNQGRLVLGISIGLVLVGGLVALVTTLNRTTLSKASKEEPANDTLPDLNRQAELTSLLLQAAANRPVDSTRYGVSAERFHTLREATLALVQELPEEQYWEQLALAAEAGYGTQASSYTLGDHFYALELAFALLEPLVDAQPCDLDLASCLQALNQAWQEGEREKAGGGVPRLYRSLVAMAPDDSGATRLLRVFLARAALAQVALRAGIKDANPAGNASTAEHLAGTTRAGRAQLGSSLSWGSIFQISGAAMFCLPPPFMAYGYLANTVGEVMFGGSDSSDSFFSALTNALSNINNSLNQIKDTQINVDIKTHIQGPIKKYNNDINNQYNSLTEGEKAGAIPLSYYHVGDHTTEASDSLLGILQTHFQGSLEMATMEGDSRWESARDLDPMGTWTILLWKLVAKTAYLTCSRQLAATYALVANISGTTNYQELAQSSSRDAGSSDLSSYRPDATTLLKAPGDASELTWWTTKHWQQVRKHIKLVKSDYIWPASMQSQRLLIHARLSTESIGGHYDQTWEILVDLWRKAAIALSMPTEIYTETRYYYQPSEFDSHKVCSVRFAHGWFTARRTSNQYCEVFADDDLLPPTGPENKVGTQAWLLAWYKQLADALPTAKLDNKESITADDQCELAKNLQALFIIGVQKPTWTYYLLQTLRKQLQAWRLQKPTTPDATKGMKAKGFNEEDLSLLHAAAWPTTGELNRIITKLDQAIPCSWDGGGIYLKRVMLSLQQRWIEMARSGADPSHLNWMQGEPCWWRDRRNADQRPMPLLPETIALILEVWVAGAIRADRLQKPIREPEYYVGTDGLVDHLNDNHCELEAQPSGLAANDAYGLPADLATRDPRQNNDFNKAYYDSHRDEIRQAWVFKRLETLDGLLTNPFGLTPSKSEMSASESMVQNWFNGLLDESLNDDLRLPTPDAINASDIVTTPGLLPPTTGASLWQKGATVQYSYQLRGLSSFKATGNDQLSEVSKLSDPAVTLGDDNIHYGIAVRVPRDALLLARQFILFRTLTANDEPNKQTTTFVGSGHFDPGQLEGTIFHDGNPPKPQPLNPGSITICQTAKPPKGNKNWIKGYRVQYGLQYLDAAGTSRPTAISDLSEPFVITDDSCGLQLTIPSDALGIATAVQVQRRILDGNGTEVEKLNAIALHPFPASTHPGIRLLTLIDGDTAPPPAPVIVQLQMTNQGLELRRSDQAKPVWSSANTQSSGKEMASCRMQLDGNLVIYDKDWKANWASNTMESAGKTNSKYALRLRANGELAIVNSINENQVLPGNSDALIHPGDAQLPLDRPDVFLRSGELMLPGQALSIDNQSPQPHTSS